MPLELRPNCEWCDRDLAPNSLEARICSYECTFCAECVETILDNVCSNCGGGFTSRPVRPTTEWRAGTGLEFQPASSRRVHSKYGFDEVRSLTAKLRDIPPEQR